MTSTGGTAPPTVRFRPTAGSVLLVLAAIASSVVIVNVFVAARRTIGWVFATAIAAWLVSAVITLLDRWVPRQMAVVLTLLALVVVTVGAWLAFGATLRSEVNRARHSLPAAAERLERRNATAADFRLAERVRSFVGQLDKRFGDRATVTRAAGTAPVYVVTGVLLLFFIGYGPRYGRAALNQIPDADRREVIRDTLSSASRRARQYILLTLAEVFVVTAVCTAVFAALGLPAPFALGLLVGAVGAVPDMGIVLGALPAVLLAVADGDRFVFIFVVGLVAGLQVVETLVLRRRLDARTLRAGPAGILAGAIVGFQLYGPGGAVYASVALVLVIAVLEEWSRRRVAADPPPDEDLASDGDLGDC